MVNSLQKLLHSHETIEVCYTKTLSRLAAETKDNILAKDIAQRLIQRLMLQLSMIVTLPTLGFDLLEHNNKDLFEYTGQERLIQSHSLARFCFELSGNSN